MTKEFKMKVVPWMLIFGGFFSLNLFPATVCGSCMIVGIVMIIERIWPEQWGSVNVK